MTINICATNAHFEHSRCVSALRRVHLSTDTRTIESLADYERRLTQRDGGLMSF